MSALTPDCDPDLSNCGSPVTGGGVRSTVVLIAVLAVSLTAVSGGASGLVTFTAGGAAVVSALVLGRRAVRLAQRATAGLVAHTPWRSRPVV
ncbi:hypothetical protein E9549_18570 [Blastococcus sp. MG754426]|uniref:hypothetical protein n=1 Tax=unclassified Blastococcus TaxID=2619396 RepID=UPI001EF114EE|nr:MULTISPECIES: hypothetical protein [unclassified Blastococcus]MCF6509391.1 hypothetical protein [Blastococcus sp. MG754426]MCF6512791.1 hypothetical protein [Blastococcus sp. MG754427]MCF6736207.1 hypothetical protein [Blastococcus sp. KM273129]